MKKLLTLICAAVFVFSLAGCSAAKDFTDKAKEIAGGETTASAQAGDISIDVNNPDGQAVINYFKSIGLFHENDGFEIWTQNHTEYWSETPVKECVGWWHPEDETKPYIMILLLDDSLADSSKEEYDEWINYIKENKALTEEFTALRIDHLVGNMAFAYSELTLDDDDVATIEAAYEQFIKDTGATPEF